LFADNVHNSLRRARNGERQRNALFVRRCRREGLTIVIQLQSSDVLSVPICQAIPMAHWLIPRPKSTSLGKSSWGNVPIVLPHLDG
jgi:hypothetical protein